MIKTLQRVKKKPRTRALSGAGRKFDGNDLAMEVLGKFREVFRAAKLHFAAVHKVLGISGAQLWALWELHEQPGLRVSELTAKMSLQQSTVSNLVERLSSAGFVRRGQDSTDQRVVRLHLTAAGKKIVARAPKPARGVLPDALEKLDTLALKKLNTNLETLLKAMRVRVPDASKTHLENI
jgi:DNA-binding MarR family transcriptional regulator